MLSERKRFNYMVNTSYHSHTSHSQKKLFPSSAIKNPLPTPREEPTQSAVKPYEDKENCKKIEELEAVNKRLIEETTKQFKKLESDVQRVEKILEEKDVTIGELKKETTSLHGEVERVNEEKKILIEAIFEKDMVIKEYEMRIKELMESKEKLTQIPASPVVLAPEVFQEGVQTEAQPETCPKAEFNQAVRQALEMEDEVYQLKQELFDANNKVKLITQQFEAYKILKQIESVQQM